MEISRGGKMDYHQAARDLLHTLKTANRLAAFKRLNEYTRGEMAVLSYLRIHENEIIVPSEISDFCKISSARVATVLNTLEDKGYVTRNIHRSDRRKILVSLTASGKTRAYAAKEETIGHLIQVLEIMGEQDTIDFIRTLQVFLNAGVKIGEKLEMEKKNG